MRKSTIIDEKDIVLCGIKVKVRMLKMSIGWYDEEQEIVYRPFAYIAEPYIKRISKVSIAKEKIEAKLKKEQKK